MANTYCQIYIHAVFTVKGRANLIHGHWKDELYKYICGIVSGNKQKVYAINGMSDHIHALLSIKPDCLLSDLMRDVKASSSKWINKKGFVMGKFQWQEGYGAFSCAQAQLDSVISYIANQETHHSRRSFREEYLELLQKYKIDYDERYVFDWIEGDVAPTELK